MVSPFFELPPSGAAQLPLFNGMTAFLCFAVFSKATSMASTTTVLGGDGVFCVPGPGTTLRDQLDRKVLNDGGTPSGQFLINEEFIATLDYLVAPACGRV